MKDGSDVTTMCNSGGKTETVPHLPFSMDNVCLRDEPITSQCIHEDVTMDTLLPESTSTWGDFESFNELTPSEQFYYADESLCLDSFDTTTSTGEDHAHKTDVLDKWDDFNLENVLQSTEECESIFRLSFPVIPVSETSEDVKNLSTLMTSSNEEHLCKLIRTRLWLDCDNIQQCGDTLPGKSGCDWPTSKGCRDLVLLLGTGAENFSDNREETNDDGVMIHDIKPFSVNDSAPPAGNKCLIQTKLDVGPGSKQGHIFSYQLFLRKSATDGPLPFLTFSGKKGLFSTNQLRFNF